MKECGALVTPLCLNKRPRSICKYLDASITWTHDKNLNLKKWYGRESKERGRRRSAGEWAFGLNLILNYCMLFLPEDIRFLKVNFTNYGIHPKLYMKTSHSDIMYRILECGALYASNLLTRWISTRSHTVRINWIMASFMSAWHKLESFGRRKWEVTKTRRLTGKTRKVVCYLTPHSRH